MKTMNPQSYSILCKYFVYFGIRFQLEIGWIVRLLSVLCSCTFNLFKANSLLALFLSMKSGNYPLRIVQILQLLFDIWLYFYLLFNQNAIAEHLDFVIGNLSKQVQSRFLRKLRLYRIVYLIFVVESLRLAVLWYIGGTDEIYKFEYPYLDQSTIDSLVGYSDLICKLVVFVALLNKLLDTMLQCISILLYLFVYYAQHLQLHVLSEQPDVYTNLVELKSRYRLLQKQSTKSNSILGILPFIWCVFLINNYNYFFFQI